MKKISAISLLIFATIYSYKAEGYTCDDSCQRDARIANLEYLTGLECEGEYEVCVELLEEALYEQEQDRIRADDKVAKLLQ